MYSLTEKRWEAIHPICDKHLAKLVALGSINCDAFEGDLRKALDVGGIELKDLAPQIAARKPYEKLAVYYMLNGNPGGPFDQHKEDIAKYIGVASYEYSVERDEAITKYFQS